MDDDFDFFTRKPSASRSKSKAKLKAPPKVANGSASNGITQPISSATAASTSQSAATVQLVGDEDGPAVATNVDALEDDDDEDVDIMLSSSDEDYPSDYSSASTRRKAKRRKKRHAKTLPAWASQGIYRRPSQEPSSLSSNSAFLDAPSGSAVKTSQLGSDMTADTDSPSSEANGTANGRARRVSLTPPPPPSPEKLYRARQLVNRTIASKFCSSTASSTTRSASSVPALSSSNDSASGSRRVLRSTRNSATPAFGRDVAVAGRSTNAKHIREKARREQREREEKRKQPELERIRQQPSSLPGSSSPRSAQFGRTQSAPQTRASAANDRNESDDSVEYVARPARKASMSPHRTRSSTTTTSTAAAASHSNNNGAILIIDDDLDEDGQASSKPNGSAAASTYEPSPSPPPAQEAAGETLALTLQSRLGSIPVTVTPTTLLSRIIQHFHEKKLDSSVKVESVRVMFDGFAYKPDQTVGDMDVEDGDQIELSWP
ncbi:hypothetical protein [Sporisorium scitamineum]|uniref:Ubiquitin-like domain-containing protein n=1 Tax=Sporisorium scitamineum TaxID=49012 RepID=A0A0F7S439_9BASI|nr:hypothetical protein [Sporisorium scitamineum]